MSMSLSYAGFGTMNGCFWCGGSGPICFSNAWSSAICMGFMSQLKELVYSAEMSGIGIWLLCAIVWLSKGLWKGLAVLSDRLMDDLIVWLRSGSAGS